MTHLGKFLKVRSGLHEGQRIDPPVFWEGRKPDINRDMFPRVAAWVEREGARKARERRRGLIEDALVCAIVGVVVAGLLQVALGIVAGMVP